MGAIANLCPRAMLLNRGQVILTGPSHEVISRYLSSIAGYCKGEVFLEESNSDVYFIRIAILDAHGQPTQTIPVTSPLVLLLEYDVKKRVSNLEVSFSLFDRNGSKVFYSGLSKSRNDAMPLQDHEPGHYVATVEIPAEFLAPGTYTITVGLHQPNVFLFDRRDHILQFSVVETGSSDYMYAGQDIGSILVQLNWTIERRD